MRLADLKRLFLSTRGYLLLLLHVAVFSASYWLAFALRFDFAIPPDELRKLTTTLPFVLVIKLVCILFFGDFHGWRRYVSFHDMVTLVRASLAGCVAIALFDYYLLQRLQIPRSVVLLDCAITILLLGGLRSAGRFTQELLWPVMNVLLHRKSYGRALLVGASRQGVALTNQIHSHRELNYRIVGYLDDDESLWGTKFSGIPVLGRPGDAAALAKSAGADDVLLVSQTIPGRDVRRIMDDCKRAGVTLRVIPAMAEMMRGQLVGPHGLRLRDVDIDDLLQRDPVELDTTAVGVYLENKVIMVTGAGGSIGSEICRQILRFQPATIVLVERSENNLFHIERELQELHLGTQIVPCIGDVLDESRMRQVFEQYTPNILIHAAAHKHVPMMEANPGEAIRNNVFGTKMAADLAKQYELESFVLISTDKAVNPTSVMGLSKQIAERYIHAISQESHTRFLAVRFGNVLGSVGSVVPVFQQQIRAGGPVTITHPEMRRFFMTIPEASQLVLQAAAMGRGGEIFVLDMGEPVKILDLAHDLIRLSGLTPDDIEIAYSGIRPGEKLYEELYFDDEQTLPTPHPKVRVAWHRPYTREEVCDLLSELWDVAQDRDAATIRARLRRAVPEFGGKEPAEQPSAQRDAEPAPSEPVAFPQFEAHRAKKAR